MAARLVLQERSRERGGRERAAGGAKAARGTRGQGRARRRGRGKDKQERFVLVCDFKKLLNIRVEAGHEVAICTTGNLYFINRYPYHPSNGIPQMA